MSPGLWFPALPTVFTHRPCALHSSLKWYLPVLPGPAFPVEELQSESHLTVFLLRLLIHHTVGASWDLPGFKGKMAMRESMNIYVVYVGRKGTGPCDRRYMPIWTDGASVTSARVLSSWIKELTLCHYLSVIMSAPPGCGILSLVSRKGQISS